MKRLRRDVTYLAHPEAKNTRSMSVSRKGSFLTDVPVSPLRISEREPKVHSSNKMQTLKQVGENVDPDSSPGRKYRDAINFDNIGILLKIRK